MSSQIIVAHDLIEQVNGVTLRSKYIPILAISISPIYILVA